MKRFETALFNRPDTFLGVCEGIGQDLGFDPNLLRVALGVAILWNPPVVLGAYLFLGMVVAVSRWLFPVRPTATLDRTPVPTLAHAENDDSLVPIAA